MWSLRTDPFHGLRKGEQASCKRAGHPMREPEGSEDPEEQRTWVSRDLVWT